MSSNMINSKNSYRTIALYLPSLDLGGAERQVLELAKGLDKSRWHVIIITNQINTLLNNELANLTGVRIIQLEKNSVLFYPLRLLALLYREKPCILNAYLISSQLYTLLIRLFMPGIKVVFSIRDAKDYAVCFGVKGRIFNKIFRVGTPLVDCYLFNSVAGSRQRNHLPAEKVHVIHNGIDTDRFAPDRSGRENLQSLTGIDKNALVVGIVGSFSQFKDHDNFIRAARIVADQYPDVHFVAVGNCGTLLGMEMQMLVDSLSLSARFHFLGNRNDVNSLLPGFDIFCSSSVSEGFANAICEAMSCEIPCVVTDVGDSAAIVGDTGIVVPPSAPDSLAAGIKKLIRLSPAERRQLGIMARSRIVANFGIPRMVAATEKVYDKVLSSR